MQEEHSTKDAAAYHAILPMLASGVAHWLVSARGHRWICFVVSWTYDSFHAFSVPKLFGEAFMSRLILIVRTEKKKMGSLCEHHRIINWQSMRASASCDANFIEPTTGHGVGSVTHRRLIGDSSPT